MGTAPTIPTQQTVEKHKILGIFFHRFQNVMPTFNWDCVEQKINAMTKEQYHHSLCLYESLVHAHICTSAIVVFRATASDNNKAHQTNQFCHIVVHMA